MAFSPDSLDGKESAHNVEDLHLLLDWEDPLSKGMAIHSSIFAWEFAGQMEPVGTVMGSQRVGSPPLSI